MGDRKGRFWFFKMLFIALFLSGLLWAIIILAFATTCHAESPWIRASGFGEKWDKWDVRLEITWEVIHGLNWLTTRNLSHRYAEGYWEMNPMLGTHPSTTTVDLYMLAGAILHPIAVHWIPKKINLFSIEIPARRIAQSITITSSTICLVRDLSIGLTFQFD